MIRIGIVDDNKHLQESLIEKLSFFDTLEVVLRASDGQDLLNKIEQHGHDDIDILLMDIEMPVMNGIEATAAVKARYANIKIIMLTVFDDDENIFNAIRSGADGYLLKEVHPDALSQGIQDTLEGGAAMTPSIALKTLKLLKDKSLDTAADVENKFELSTREVEVLEYLSTGMSYTVIAAKLYVAPSTVRKHIENIYKKLNVHNKLEAVQLAKKHAVIK